MYCDLTIDMSFFYFFDMFSTDFWLLIIGCAFFFGCSWIFSNFQKSSYKREIRNRRSFVLLAKLLAEEEKIACDTRGCKGDGTGEVYLALPEGVVQVFSHRDGKFAISLLGAVLINDLHADMAREFCKELNANEKRIRYSVGFEPAIAKTGFSITCDFEDEVDEEAAEYYILSYVKTYLGPKKQELETLWKSKISSQGK